jgi:hypothetical protein
MASGGALAQTSSLPGVVAAAGRLALAGQAGAGAALVFLHMAPTGLSAQLDAVSRYGISPFRGFYRVMTLGLAVAAAALAGGVAAPLPGAGRIQVVGLLAVFACARAAISWYPMERPGPRARRRVTPTASSPSTPSPRRPSVLCDWVPCWSVGPAGTGAGPTAFGAVMLVAALGVVGGRRSPWLRDRFGAVERVLYVAIVGWLGLFAVACALRLA